MKKEVKNNKKEINIKRILLIFASIILLFLLVWFGFSFFSMKSEEPYVAMEIYLEDNDLADKVVRDFPRRDGKYIEYDFPIILEEYTNVTDGYNIKGVPYNFQYYYDSRDEARFSLTFDKNKGDFNFSDLEWNEPLMITFQYRVDRDFRYFMDFSLCTIKRAYMNLFDIDNSCSRGNCIIKRNLTAWRIAMIDREVADKESFVKSFETDVLEKGLFNYYITNDFGYFDENSYKVRTKQISNPDGTHMLNTTFVNKETVGSENSSTLPWLLGITSQIYLKEYEDYSEINLMSYMKNMSGYLNEKVAQTFFDCQIAYETVKNLAGCKTDDCSVVKDTAYESCKYTLDYQVKKYDSLIGDYYGLDTNGNGNSFMINLPSEMIYFNKIVDLLGLKVEKYEKSRIYSLFNNSEKMQYDFPSILGNCSLLKVSEEVKKEYQDSTLNGKINSLYSTLPEFSTLCNDIIKDEYCSSSIAQKLICADATSYSYPEDSKKILYDIFYRHYFSSPASSKLPAYEMYRANPTFNKNVKNLPELLDYGYFVDRREGSTEEGVTVTSFADMLDSFYFIYLSNKINEK